MPEGFPDSEKFAKDLSFMTHADWAKLHKWPAHSALELEKRKEALSEFGISAENTTCHTCDLQTRCPSVYDPYNTDGDCLEEK
jgi:hypothetical protein